MSTIQDKYATLLPQVEQIIGNVKGGVKTPVQAAEEIHTIYAQFIQTEIRYPSEPKLLTGQPLTSDDLEMANHFSQADKNK